VGRFNTFTGNLGDGVLRNYATGMLTIITQLEKGAFSDSECLESQLELDFVMAEAKKQLKLGL
jgi:hypothetical protein